MERISIVFIYYNKNYATYGKLIESVLCGLFDKEKPWVHMLVVNAISICYENILAKYGAVDVRSQDGKDLLNLSRKLAECKTMKDPKCCSMLLMYAINFAVGETSFEFLIFVTTFIENLKANPDRKKEILEHLKKKVPASHTKSDPVLYFGEHLLARVTNPSSPSKAQYKRGRPQKVSDTPKIKPNAPKIQKPKDKKKVLPKKPSQSESEVSDSLTIHDSSSDDLDLDVSTLNISD